MPLLPVAVLLGAPLLGACGGGSPAADPADEGSGAASIELRDDAGSRDAPTPVTAEYLTGRWCFHRESRDGEAGIVEFDPDGTIRTGIHQVWTQDEVRWDVTEDLAGFRRGYPEIVDIEPDRFVGIMRGGHRVVFDRAPCR